MARTFVFSDNLTARVEILTDDGGHHRALCTGCNVDLVEDSRESWNFEDTQQAAEIHVDRCTRCADETCRNTSRHDAGHRCRKI